MSELNSSKTFSRVFVTVGTTKFNKLIEHLLKIETLETLIGIGCRRLVIQAGASDIKVDCDTAKNSIEIEVFKYKDSLQEDIEKADLIIGHAGAGTALEVLRCHKPLVMVVNDCLMNNHQFELSNSLRNAQYVVSCTPSELKKTLAQLPDQQLQSFPDFNPSLFASYLDARLFNGKVD